MSGQASPELVVLSAQDAPGDLLRAIRALLDEAFAEAFSDDDWAHTLGGWHVIAREDSRLVAHAAVVGRVLEVDGVAFATGYVEGVATAPDRQGERFGSRVMERANDLMRAHFEFGALSTERTNFYARLGWERWRGPTYVRVGAALRRTAEEDDGVMVLRFGPSAGVDLTSPISCETRAGDDW